MLILFSIPTEYLIIQKNRSTAYFTVEFNKPIFSKSAAPTSQTKKKNELTLQKILNIARAYAIRDAAQVNRETVFTHSEK